MNYINRSKLAVFLTVCLLSVDAYSTDSTQQQPVTANEPVVKYYLKADATGYITCPVVNTVSPIVYSNYPVTWTIPPVPLHVSCPAPYLVKATGFPMGGKQGVALFLSDFYIDSSSGNVIAKAECVGTDTKTPVQEMLVVHFYCQYPD